MTIRDFIASPGAPQGTLDYRQLQGFLFTVASAPELIRPSEWMPEIFGGEMPSFESMTQAQAVLDSLRELYNSITADVREHGGRLPRDCRLRGEALSNLDADAPIRGWSTGFVEGHNWLSETWDTFLERGELEQELSASLMTLSFFASPKMAEAFRAECAPDKTLREMAEVVRKNFRDAAASYALLGRALELALSEVQDPALPNAGRNEPCPCGSGKKFKRCCGG